MATTSLYALLADALLVVHVLVVTFIVLGLVAIWVGRWRRWAWVRDYRFRLLHLAAIAVVVLQSWLGEICPLTVWEMRLRTLAGGASYEGSFVQHWLQRVLYYDAPEWIFVVTYTLFGGLVVAAWLAVPPDRCRRP